jgi:hypothetical protein
MHKLPSNISSFTQQPRLLLPARFRTPHTWQTHTLCSRGRSILGHSGSRWAGVDGVALLSTRSPLRAGVAKAAGHTGLRVSTWGPAAYWAQVTGVLGGGSTCRAMKQTQPYTGVLLLGRSSNVLNSHAYTVAASHNAVMLLSQSATTQER